MTFIAAYHDKQTNKVAVWEKNSFNQRVRTLHKPIYYFYALDPEGKYKTLMDQSVSRIVCGNFTEYEAVVEEYKTRGIPVFESDFSSLERVLQDLYSTKAVPTLSTCFLDIETDYNPALGYTDTRPENPQAPINAITLHVNGEFHTLAVPPKSWNWKKTLPEKLHNISNITLVKTEKELLEKTISLITKCDVISGWNSEFFDLPYIGGRIELVLGEHALVLLGFEGGPTPRWAEKERFKGATKKERVLDLITRVHLDYLKLFQKFDLVRRQSYSLDNVSLEELGQQKVSYAGSLHDCYNNDFELFLEYNIHDVTLLVMLDKKKKYIELANRVVHESSCLFHHVFGSVNVIDSAIVNYSHNVLNRIVMDKKVREQGPPVEGAIVMTPIPGFYKNIGAVDIASLYPNTIRSLNLSPEKIIGQLQGFEADWQAYYKAICNPNDESAQTYLVKFTIDELNETLAIPIGEFVAICAENKYAVSGYGSIIDQGNGLGVLPSILGFWFAERKRLQGEKKKFVKLADTLEKDGLKNTLEWIEASSQAEYFDMLQGVKKLQLNSCYGALLNAYMRFGDPRLGASTTFSGRQITSRMVNVITSCLNPDKPTIKKEIIKIEKKKRTGDIEIEIENRYTIDIGNNSGVIYSDTDSGYFTMKDLVSTSEEAIELADNIADIVNDEFPVFMQSAFNCQPGYENLIKVNRELVCSSGILQAKKKYMMKVIDKEGKRIVEGSDDELKTMGSDIKLSSTPKKIRDMLKEVVLLILNEQPIKTINKVIMDFRKSLTDSENYINPLDLATVNSVNKLDEATTLWEQFEKNSIGKAKLHVNVRSAINHNYMLEIFKDTATVPIKSGDKVKILWLQKNAYEFTSMAFASETEELPKWFHDNFEIDKKAMEQKLVDAKLELIFSALKWEVPTYQSEIINECFEF